MKKTILIYISVLAFTAVSFINPPDKLIGRWKPKTPAGYSAVTVFRADDTFDIFVNGKTFVSGKYKVNQDTLPISDPICGTGYYGTYKLTYITEDSVRQTLIKDTCRVRRYTIEDSPTMSRVKAVKP